ncbi:two-component sensor histidine kinase [Thermobispora bispora]|jgi:two-component system, OmpR family, sensor histidine kinase SenX3|uniref:sensor histidine kinase n=1 Tax=Thermobispora bispora TaxID=2006 RepID=UPI0019821C48|nr:ATP-binding protein [Thermobispora bispora]MBO2475201.1 two-component sensor histidine kinase [Actinomycetales bacterium]MBX6167450.1 two-component sensor histidine kinase [Thermobispora bispora]MDI9580180.1 ATP-binding protein [Thermobispora sp.]QSI47181.1 two-component sensor histidine kinase [Thermobispora bispora]
MLRVNELLASLAAMGGFLVGAFVMLAIVRTLEFSMRQRDRGDDLAPGVASVLAVLPSSAVVLDRDDRVLRASPAARAFGLVRGDTLMAAELLAMARKVRRDGEIRESEIETRGGRFGQDTTTFAVRVAPLGTDGQVLVLAEDQTERQRVEAVRRDFVANVSHELKTPVGALSLLAETVMAAADDPEAVRRFAGRMQHEAARLTNLIQDLITLSRIQGGEPIPSPAPVLVDDVIREAIDRCNTKASAKGIQLVTAGAQGLQVWGDDDLLVTALRNLIDNAIAYSPEKTRVVVSSRSAHGYVEVSVADQGIGIPEEAQQRIFERFFRVDAARSRATGGTGLGLAIVKHVAVAHGGEVTVWSKEGSGSTFTLRLPAYAGEPASSRTDTPVEAAQ